MAFGLMSPKSAGLGLGVLVVVELPYFNSPRCEASARIASYSSLVNTLYIGF